MTTTTTRYIEKATIFEIIGEPKSYDDLKESQKHSLKHDSWRTFEFLALFVAMFLLIACKKSPEYTFKDIGTSLEEIITSEPVPDESENALLDEAEYNNRTCIRVESFSEVDRANMRFTGHTCLYAEGEDFYVKNSSFQSPEGRMPYIEIGRTPQSTSLEKEQSEVAMYLVGGPSSIFWRGTESFYGVFFQELLSEYDTIFIPAYYGTNNRMKAQGDISEAAARELDFFLDFISHEGTSTVDVIGFSSGGALSTLLKSPNIQRVIMLSPVLVSMRRIYRERNEPAFHGSTAERDKDAGLVVELGDVFTLGRSNRRYYFENNADFVVRYYGKLFDVSVLDYMRSGNYKYGECAHILVGTSDKVIGQDLIDFDDFPAPYSRLEGVDHIYANTPLERKAVIDAIRNVRSDNSKCN